MINQCRRYSFKIEHLYISIFVVYFCGFLDQHSDWNTKRYCISWSVLKTIQVCFPPILRSLNLLHPGDVTSSKLFFLPVRWIHEGIRGTALGRANCFRNERLPRAKGSFKVKWFTLSLDRERRIPLSPPFRSSYSVHFHRFLIPFLFFLLFFSPHSSIPLLYPFRWNFTFYRPLCSVLLLFCLTVCLIVYFSFFSELSLF